MQNINLNTNFSELVFQNHILLLDLLVQILEIAILLTRSICCLIGHSDRIPKRQELVLVGCSGG